MDNFDLTKYLAEGKLLQEELKGDILQSVAKEIASKNNMEFKMVDGLGSRTEDNVDKILGSPSKERNEEFKKPHLVLSKKGDNAYYLFMFGLQGIDDLLNKVWSEFGEKWETYAPGTKNIAKNDKLNHGTGIGSNTYSIETGEPVKLGDQTENDTNVLFVTKYINGDS
jgi:hypothetical protein